MPEKDESGRPIPSRAVKVFRECVLSSSLGPMNGEREVFRAYIDRNDWWIGYYRGDSHHYVCVLPCVVLRFPRRVVTPPATTAGGDSDG